MEDIEKTESKAERFVRLAEPRVSRACKSISLIANLASSGDEYSEKQVDSMFAALQSELDAARSAFNKDKKKRFKF